MNDGRPIGQRRALVGRVTFSLLQGGSSQTGANGVLTRDNTLQPQYFH